MILALISLIIYLAGTLTGVLGFSDPVAIVGFVIPVVVDTVDLQIIRIPVCRGPIAEWFKRLPCVAYDNASSAVSPTRFFAMAPLPDAIPDFGEPGGRSVMRFVQKAGSFVVKTAAGLGVAVSQMVATDKRLASTVAPAQPLGVDFRGLELGSLYDDQPPVTSTCEVDETHSLSIAQR